MIFKDVPQSLGEVRAEREKDCSKWTPRDVLIHVLRQIDAGKINPASLVVCYGGVDEKGFSNISYEQAGPNWLQRMAVVDHVAAMMHRPD